MEFSGFLVALLQSVVDGVLVEAAVFEEAVLSRSEDAHFEAVIFEVVVLERFDGAILEAAVFVVAVLDGAMSEAAIFDVLAKFEDAFTEAADVLRTFDGLAAWSSAGFTVFAIEIADSENCT